MTKLSEFMAKADQNGSNILEYREFNQIAVMNDSTIGGKGMCAAFSTIWLRSRYDFTLRERIFTYLNSSEGKEESMALMLNYFKTKSSATLSEHMQGFGYTELVNSPPTPNLDDIKNAILLPGLYLVGFDGPTGGHEIAVDGLSFVVFDPNFGSFKFGDPTATAKFTKNLIRSMYKKISAQADYVRLLMLD